MGACDKVPKKLYKSSLAARLRSKIWYTNNRERAKANSRNWHHKNKKRNNAASRAWRLAYPEASRVGKQKCYARRPEHYATKAANWVKKHPRRRKQIARASHVLTKYGLPAARYFSLLKACGGRCPICLFKFAASGAHIESVDHDHKTGEVRGLICRLCNSGLGMFQDSAEIVERAAVYLK